jgi:hypothetical protein
VRDRVQQGESVGVAQAGHLEFGQPGPGRRVPKTTPIDSASSRRATKASAWVALAATPALLAGLLRTLARAGEPARQNGSRAARDVN